MQDFITIWQYIQDCLFFNNVYGQNCEKTEKSLPFKAGKKVYLIQEKEEQRHECHGDF